MVLDLLTAQINENNATEVEFMIVDMFNGVDDHVDRIKDHYISAPVLSIV